MQQRRETWSHAYCSPSWLSFVCVFSWSVLSTILVKKWRNLNLRHWPPCTTGDAPGGERPTETEDQFETASSLESETGDMVELANSRFFGRFFLVRTTGIIMSLLSDDPYDESTPFAGSSPPGEAKHASWSSLPDIALPAFNLNGAQRKVQRHHFVHYFGLLHLSFQMRIYNQKLTYILTRRVCNLDFGCCCRVWSHFLLIISDYSCTEVASSWNCSSFIHKTSHKYEQHNIKNHNNSMTLPINN